MTKHRVPADVREFIDQQIGAIAPLEGLQPPARSEPDRIDASTIAAGPPLDLPIRFAILDKNRSH